MDRYFEGVVACAAEVLETNLQNLNEDSSIGYTEKWDSMAHLNILMCLEKKYLIEFTEDDFVFLKSVADITKKLEELLD